MHLDLLRFSLLHETVTSIRSNNGIYVYDLGENQYLVGE